MTVFAKFKHWLLVRLANGQPVVMNVNLKGVICIDTQKSKGGLYHNINTVGGEYGVKFD